LLSDGGNLAAHPQPTLNSASPKYSGRRLIAVVPHSATLDLIEPSRPYQHLNLPSLPDHVILLAGYISAYCQSHSLKGRGRPKDIDFVAYFVSYHYPAQSYWDLKEALQRRTPATSKTGGRTLQFEPLEQQGFPGEWVVDSTELTRATKTLWESTQHLKNHPHWVNWMEVPTLEQRDTPFDMNDQGQNRKAKATAGPSHRPYVDDEDEETFQTGTSSDGPLGIAPGF
jgi:hypothetical protein